MNDLSPRQLVLRAGQQSADSPASQLLRYIQLDLLTRLRERRWLMPLLVLPVLALILSKDLLILAQQGLIQANAWDMVFRVLASPYAMFYCLTPLYLYLMSDLGAQSGFDDAILLRLRSRQTWWIGKTATLVLLTGLYVLLLAGLTATIASLILPWQLHWSEYVRHDPSQISLTPAVLSRAPLRASGEMFMLMMLGWFSLGLVVLVVGQLFRSVVVGFGAGMLLNLVAIILFHTFLDAPYDRLFINYHLLFSLHAFGELQSPYPALSSSYLYWLVWIAVLLPSGWQLTRRQDFLRKA